MDELIQELSNGEWFLLKETWMVMLEKIVGDLKEFMEARDEHQIHISLHDWWWTH